MKRQKIRRLLLILSMLLFPVTLYYFSPALIFNAGMEGIINGSFIVFAIMLIGSVFFGRIFCAYLCPAGGLQECVFPVNDKIPKRGFRNYIKYIIWAVWITAVVFCYASRGQIIKVDFFFETEHGISVSNVYAYVIYYGIVLLIILPALIGGKRAFCHYFCWMAPFMVIGTKLRGLLRLLGLSIAANCKNCGSCGRCDKACPMGIEVSKTLENGGVVSIDCILCGACVDICPKNALAYSMRKGGGHNSK